MTTAKRRVLSAIERRAPDVPAVGFKATDEVLRALARHYAVTETREIVDRLPVDTYGAFNNTLYGVYPDYAGGPPKLLYPGSYADGSWDTIYGYKRRWVKHRSGLSDELVGPPPLAGAETVEDMARHEWPDADWFDYGTVKQQCEEVDEYAVIFNLGGLGHVANLIGHERFFADMYVNPAVIEYAFDRLITFYLEFADRVFRAAEGGIDIVVIQDDFGTQRGPLISIELFRRFFRPQLRRVFETAHRHGVRTMMHSCGAVFEFIPDFIEIGADVLDPVQTTAAGMEPRRLKSEYGKHICFHGGVDTQHLLVEGTPADVVRHAAELLAAFGEDGFIIAPGHYIQGDAPIVNILALYDYLRALR